MRCWLAALAVLATALVVGASVPLSLRQQLLALPQTPDLGGETTRPLQGQKAFTFLAANARREHERPFFFGNRIFNTNWVAAPASVKSFDGLGPTFNRVSCAGCHTFDGRGRPPEAPGQPFESMLVRLSVPGTDAHGGIAPDPTYGDQLNDRALPGVPAEGRVDLRYEEIGGTYGDGTPFTLLEPVLQLTDLAFGPSGDGLMTSSRVAPQMIGLGLLEAVPEATLEALADPDDADHDGISGRPNRVWDPTAGAMMPGRFGWKANVASLATQNANAALGDIGLTTALHPQQNCPRAQAACAEAPTGGEPELAQAFLDKLTLYTRLLAVPRQRNVDDPAVRRGVGLFRAAGCAACHLPTLQTAATADLPELAGQTIHPFTDLLLHDMGPDLADGRPDGQASGSEWRTPPLWGLGLVPQTNGHDRLLHDGRARGFAEAILWHGGEARPAREAFRTMSAQDREALIAYLGSL
ncbi:MAG: di-heme oxidoredictase family protein [Geminicoccaceae bacterium]